jgi:hypothetical protein
MWSGIAGAQDQPRFTVSGVVIKEGGAVAWIGEPAYTKNRLLRVREGDQIGPYRVAAIREDRVELTGPSGPVVVRLSVSAPDMPSEPAAGAAAAAPSGGKPVAAPPGSPSGGSAVAAPPGSPSGGSAVAAVPGTAGTRAPARTRLTPEQEARVLQEIRSHLDSVKATKPKNSGWSRFMPNVQ